MSRISLLSLTSAELALAAKTRLPSGAGIAVKLYRQVFREGRFAPEEFGIAARSAVAWRECFEVQSMTVQSVVEESGPLGITAKAILRLHDGYEVECVYIPMGNDRSTLCISSQVGCKMGCTFCETGRLGLLRQLRVDEIVGQMVIAQRHLGWGFRNVVFMGMGEALDNAQAVFQAIRIGNDPMGLALAQERFTICTVGTAEGLTHFANAGFKRVGLSISLNAGDDATRSKIMPINRRLPLADLAPLLAAYRPRANFVLGVNYCLLPGINATRDDAAKVADFCRQIPRVLVNVIPYNPGHVPLTRAPDEDEIEAFLAWLRDEGLPVRRRMTKGRSVMAACGQLGNVELRARTRRLPVISPS